MYNIYNVNPKTSHQRFVVGGSLVVARVEEVFNRDLVGATEGETLTGAGAFEGFAVVEGFNEGVTMGSLEDGSTEGFLVGMLVGPEEGFLVGALDGTKDGLIEDGLADGDILGS